MALLSLIQLLEEIILKPINTILIFAQQIISGTIQLLSMADMNGTQMMVKDTNQEKILI
jgi:hypothetical protein